MKKALPIFLVILVVGIGGIILSWQTNTPPLAPDIVAMNDAVKIAMDSGDQGEAVTILTTEMLRQYEFMEVLQTQRDQRILIYLCAYTGFILLAGLGLYLYCENSILKPFRKMQRFARDVAMGNLDLPLEMDRGGRFGAFTESFDLMRDELRIARENERAAERSKKELVAALSHDIKTPVASIKAAMDLLLVSATEKERTHLERIVAKADQINALITDIFHSTLEELQALTVTPVEIPSTALPDLINYSDYNRRVGPFTIPECIVVADSPRLQQVFDNIIGNSYKYADTDITVDAAIKGTYLDITISDTGPGVLGEELPLLTNKFYRGGNVGNKAGYGMGLYIAHDLVERMSGCLEVENLSHGFAVHIMLRLAG